MSSKDQQASQPTGQHPASGSEHAVEPSGPKGDNPATAGPGPTKIQSGTPENRLGRINPSAPEDATPLRALHVKSELGDRRPDESAPGVDILLTEVPQKGALAAP